VKAISLTADRGELSLAAQRRASKRGTLPAVNAAVLDSVDPLWREHSYDRRWRQQHGEYVAFITEHGHVPSQTSRDVAEKRLGLWRAAQRRARQKNTLAPYRLDILNTTVGHRWDVFDEEWDKRLLTLRKFFDRHGVVPSKGGDSVLEKLAARWLHQQRQSKRAGQLAAERDAELTTLLGQGWELPVDRWNLGLATYQRFLSDLGRPPQKSSVDADERVVSEWMHNQRTRYRKGTLSTERIASLEAIRGHVWRAR